MFNGSAVLSFNVILLLTAIVHYDIFLNEMIFTLICINSQPISHVINVYYETQMMILRVNCIYHKGYQLLCLYSFLLSTES